MIFVRPNTVIDIGANIGAWSEGFAELCPDARFILIEAYPPHYPTLLASASKLKNAKVIIALLGAEAKPSVPFHVVLTENYPGSSVYPENTRWPQEVQALPMHTLDEVLTGETLRTPVILKIDAQGSELAILKGASQLLPYVGMLQLEMSLVDYNKGAPQFHEVIAWLAEHNYFLYDINPAHRKQDGNLYQLDAVFVRKDYPLRTHDHFWNDEPEVST